MQSRINYNDINNEFGNGQSGKYLQSLLNLQRETLSSQQEIINSMHQARNVLQFEIYQSQQLEAKSAFVIPANKAQQDRVRSARIDEVGPPAPSFQPAIYKHYNRHGFRGGFNQYQK